REHLADADGLVAGLTTRAGDLGALRELFRHIHSLKGMAASMGIPALASLAHVAEDLMDDVRSGTIVATTHTPSLLLDTLSCMDAMLDAAEKGRPVTDGGAPELESRLQAARVVPVTLTASSVAPDAGGCATAQPSAEADARATELVAYRLDLTLASDASV